MVKERNTGPWAVKRLHACSARSCPSAWPGTAVEDACLGPEDLHPGRGAQTFPGMPGHGSAGGDLRRVPGGRGWQLSLWRGSGRELTEGVISHTLDMFLNSPLKICGEVTLRIHPEPDGQQSRSWCAEGRYRINSHWRSAAAGLTATCRRSNVYPSAAMPRPPEGGESRTPRRLPGPPRPICTVCSAGAEYRGRSRQHHPVSGDRSAVSAAVGR